MDIHRSLVIANSIHQESSGPLRWARCRSFALLVCLLGGAGARRWLDDLIGPTDEDVLEPLEWAELDAVCRIVGVGASQ